jgi:hypothetical protein
VSAALHPAERRRLARMMPPEAHGETELRPLGGGDGRAIIVTSEARDFIEKLLEDLKAPDWSDRLAARRGLRRGDDSVLELGLPIHRKFQLALFEARCVGPGFPRLDPAKIASKGLVLRRVTGGTLHGWTRAGSRVSGWRPVGTLDDPDPARRSAAHGANAAVRSLIALANPVSALREETIPLYLAPPDVCAATGRTILYGLIPLVSSERSEEPAPQLDYATHPQRPAFEAHLSGYLKARPETDLPRATKPLHKGWNVLDPTGAGEADRGQLNSLGIFLQQLAVELDALGTGNAGIALMNVLAEIRLPLSEDQHGRVTSDIDAAAFVRSAVPILLEGADNPTGVAMPLSWPKVDEALGARLVAAALDCLTEQHSRVEPSPGKFDVASDVFTVRGFIRLRGHGGCPDRLIWTQFPSEPFRICPWWDGDGPGTRISLPDFSQLKKVKPNVAFEMPPALANLLKSKPKDLMDGSANSPDGSGLGWLCSFSIPIITLCAFICLNIFLSLFDLFLRWMMFIKICIPIPRKG